ncbi:REP element-mobilizing transposase RayT [Duganella sp. 1224]|uniref:transposase n=1 Tax=Duganella sp. 1224 TaxID=2587052 RepID=UPI0015C91901|nr:transposase [Duganella sp. 1224]NYE60288.1 REP element-mobilizing transposase RayT [Duganella sp. 1224]
MTRPLRLEFPGALYHVTSRGDRKALIYYDDTDRAVWLQTLKQVCERFHFAIYAFCQMGNHYHILVETLDGHLAQGMRQLNGIYSQYFNRRHGLVGHVFQGRYKAILVDKESYLLELTRYIVLNPVRARLVKLPEDWRWSSYHLTLSDTPPPDWLAITPLLTRFHPSMPNAKEAFRQFVHARIDCPSPLINTVHQLILGDEAFQQQFQRPTTQPQAGIPKSQRSALAPPLSAYSHTHASRDDAIAAAYGTHAYTLSEIARHFGVSLTTASRAVKKAAKP